MALGHNSFIALFLCAQACMCGCGAGFAVRQQWLSGAQQSGSLGHNRVTLWGTTEWLSGAQQSGSLGHNCFLRLCLCAQACVH